MRKLIMESIRWAFKSGSWNPTREEWLQGIACVQKEEVERISRFVFKKDSKSALIGRLLIRKLITEELHVPYQEIELSRTEKGKPYLINLPQEYKDFSFNISHQGDFVVLAAEQNRQVGVDVMKTELSSYQTVPEFFRLMTRQFTPQEWTTIKSHSTEREQLECFYRFWCLKESYVKALGSGINLDLQRFDFHLGTPQLSDEIVTTDTHLYVDGNISNWSFEESKQDDQHQLAVALAPRNEIFYKENSQERHPNRFSELQFADILSSAVALRSLSQDHWDNFTAKKESPNQR